MENGQSAYMIEKHEDGFYTYLTWDVLDENGPICWTMKVDLGLKFADRESADIMCKEMPDDWDIRIVEHLWDDGSKA